MSWPTFVRLLAISTAGVILAQVAIVFYVYLLAFRRAPSRRGLIPRHVLGVSVFAVLTEVVFVGFIYDLLRRDAPLTVFGPVMLIANVDLIVALAAIFRYDRRRVSTAVPPGTDPDVPQRRAGDRVLRSNKWWGRRVGST